MLWVISGTIEKEGYQEAECPCEVEQMTKKDFEDELAVQMEAIGLPKPIRQHKPYRDRKWTVDFAWPDIPTLRDGVNRPKKLILEVEGGVFAKGRHTRGVGFSRDCIKYNTLEILGWKVLRVTTNMVTNGTALDFIEWALTGQNDRRVDLRKV